MKLPDLPAQHGEPASTAPSPSGAVTWIRGPMGRGGARCSRLVRAAPTAVLGSVPTAASPGIIASAMLNEHYASYRDYVMAVAEALRVEYAAIASHGLVVQIDCPDLAMERHTSYADRPLAEFLDYVELNVDGDQSRARRRGSRSRVRMHVCWGNYEGRTTDDVPLDDLLDRLYAARDGAASLSGANPRHEHEHKALQPPPIAAGLALGRRA